MCPHMCVYEREIEDVRAMAKKRKVGRPVLPKSQRHGRTYAVRVTVEQDRIIQRELKRRGCSISGLFRELLPVDVKPAY